ncbi:MAG: MSHA biogenesis protein MshK [Herminiimonas sp.]|nr:MSHA biogenesis protein MshK [Herminiimonas sp.]
MAQHLSADHARRKSWLLVLLAAPAAFTLAQGVADPTRPPDSMTVPGITASDAAMTAATALPVLQSILIADTYAEAIINGKAVRPGDQIAMGKIVKISESEVTVRTNAGLQTLKLFPGIEKRYAAAQDTAAPVKRNKAKTK